MRKFHGKHGRFTVALGKFPRRDTGSKPHPPTLLTITQEFSTGGLP